MARNTRELATVSDEDVPDPNGEWGWNGGFPRGTTIAGVISIIALLTMTIGNHEGHIEDFYLVGFAALIAVGIIVNVVRKRNAWRR